MSNNLKITLKKYWGYNSFRPLQQKIINCVLNKKDVLALLPTSGGKSICFQIPALLMDGTCIVISPLIALMQDQVNNLKAKNISCASVNSSMKKKEIDIVLDNCIYGNIKILYGGSVNNDNAKEIFSCKDVGGLLIGGVSLKVDKFSEICINV